MAPLTPHWVQPSHPDRLEIIANEAAFTSKSLSKASFPPFAVFSKLTFPPCTPAENATYATVQMGKGKHLNLNSDLLYINHSCDPSLMFDTTTLNVIVGPKGLKEGDELTFFYPSTEWDMAQPFDCFCGAATCRGRISGARDMTAAQLEGLWLNGHIRELLEERDAAATNGANGINGSSKLNGTNGKAAATPENGVDLTAEALKDALDHAEQTVRSAKLALTAYLGSAATPVVNGLNGDASKAAAQRRGVTSREMSGEMGGDTTSPA